MAQELEERGLQPPVQTREDAHTIQPPSPSPSEPEEFRHDTTSTSRTPSQRPTVEPTSTAPTPNTSLANNPDYIALQSALTILNAQHKQAIDDMHNLLQLKQKALADPAWFIKLAETRQLNDMVPKSQNIVKCPKVEWERYGSLGSRLGRELEKPTLTDPLMGVRFWFSTWSDLGCPNFSAFDAERRWSVISYSLIEWIDYPGP
jgi:hypothetical protein